MTCGFTVAVHMPDGSEQKIDVPDIDVQLMKASAPIFSVERYDRDRAHVNIR